METAAAVQSRRVSRSATPLFSPDEFTVTKWSSADDKAWFANYFVGFVLSDFRRSLLTRRFYERLSNTFGHIAHYNLAGFWDESFSNTAAKVRFLEATQDYPCYGDPAWTYSDVERELRKWVRDEGFVLAYRRRLAAETEAGERELLKALESKYKPAGVQQA